MKKYLKILIIFVIFFSKITTFGNYEFNKDFIEKFYEKILINTEKKYSNNIDKKNYLENFSKKIGIIKTGIQDEELKKVFTYLHILNIKEISKINSELNENKKEIIIKDNSEVSSGNAEKEESISKNEDELIEESNSLFPEDDIPHPEYVEELIKNGYKLLLLNSNQEFKENNTIYRLKNFSYYSLDKDNYKYFLKNREEYIVLYNGKYLVTDKYEKEEKYTFEKLSNIFKYHFDNDKIFFLEDNYYYTFTYGEYAFFDGEDSFYLSNLKANDISPETSLLIKRNDKIFFVKNYKKIKLFHKNFVDNITNKDRFIEAVISDVNKIGIEPESILNDIKLETEKLVKDVKYDEEKIEIIYDWIRDNIDYYYNYTDGTTEIYLGILTFKNKIGVCDGLSKLYLYMLSFAGIDNVYQETGYVINNSHFPEYGHAWNRIGDNYYDVTYDITSKTNGKVYFQIPKDLMYYNKITLKQLADYKNLSKEKRDEIVLKNMFELYKKYPENAVLRKVSNLAKLGFDYDSEINLDIFIEKFGVYEVKNNKINLDGKEKQLKSYLHYNVTDSSLKSTITYGKVDFDDFKLLKLINDDGTFEYQLAYEIKYY